MDYNIRQNLHEIVIPTDPLSFWYCLFVNQNTQTYVAPHWHSGIELSYTQTGEIDDFHIAGTHYSTKAGRILIVNSQVIHGSSNRIQKFHTALGIIFPFNTIRRLYPNIVNKVIQLNDPSMFNAEQKLYYAKLQGLLNQFIAMAESDDEFKFIIMQKLADQVLLILLTKFTVNMPSKMKNSKKAYIVNRLQFITQYVNNHYKEDISLDLLAKKCNVSKNYLARFFKQEMEITVNAYINNVRAQNAHSQMLGGKYNLTDLSSLNGFSGVKTMNRTFKRLYGQTVSELKKDLKNK
ncbi:AraC family transcriptional regulator [Lactobacillus paragasseri]|uniref:AraC family transcriptional regulator n=1 Tax=Lactobacillus paragasseri TaxID=2107999 RepID=UPI001CC3D94F|nr:AraC family transcriptional regulator [Lactobacillus paragasseri]GIL32733.1 AraC family transcriptional regulator [Lactobacillus paragasseri]